ncbi:hypothetical protein [Haloarcula sediminis]|uniref:hypothetical protein n=1 Tax=Haloarcula sediminis TaxID=3111777 RepID=UPI002D7801FA|nr:hypothetical protein [Haloarcula sp. CK38]
MDARRRLLLSHFTLGLGGLGVFALTWRRLPTLVDIPVMTVVALVAAGSQYLSEREAFPAWLYAARDYGRAHPLVLVAGTTVVVAVVLTPMYVAPSTIRWYYDAFFGLYLGFIGHRIVYGLVLPVPEAALDRV